ncbi:MAG TPA: serine/threonine-protein kinase [Gemmatimonadales bacterium]|nr:serine/threonine-protein kinase [Gemmatimonadales bacterium]
MADLRAALGHALEPAYRVEREVRPVGNCRMFVALEKSAGDSLLVKVLPGPLSLAVDSARFEQEIARLGRRLQHPGLVTPRSAGRAGSLVYHTRTFVEGTTLRAWLARHGELPLRRAVEVLRDVLVALAHAHAEGVAHGDLKPENVLLADGQALVADAGILGALVQALTSDGGGAATATLCAADYLAPERRAGQPAPAPRDDMFAVGVLVHEMLTGRPPAGNPEPLEEVRSVPAWLAELGRRCRAPEPSVRWPDAGAALASGSWPGGGT